MKFQNTCKYCGKKYRLSFNDHKVRHCPHYPLNARSNCKYCGKKLTEPNHTHLAEKCEKVPTIIKQWAKTEHIKVEVLKGRIKEEKRKGFVPEREHVSIWIVNGEKRPKKS